MENKFHYIELEDLIGRPPKIYIRIGGIVLLVVIGLTLLLSSFIIIPSTKQIPLNIFVKNAGEYITKSKNDIVLYTTDRLYNNEGDTIILLKKSNKIMAIKCPYNCTVYKTVNNQTDTILYFSPTERQYYLQASVDIQKIKDYLDLSSFEVEIEQIISRKVDDVIFKPIIGEKEILIEGVFPDSINRTIRDQFPLVQKLKGNLILERKKNSVLSTILGINI